MDSPRRCPRAWNVGTGPQGAGKSTAGSLWTESDYVLTKPLGGPHSPDPDHNDRKKLLDEAGVRAGHLHGARHTAATVLMMLGIPDRVIDQIMGWAAGTSSRMRALPARA